ncbi:YadA-like family protein [uncultured Sneathia sp.]|uniref:YadA-like family protein n=2 Tax=Sneathia TaxID=168808 RepID=UPI00259B3940|nr:YadA-like family protein [uncultured Sneathia sp.]
MNILGKYKIYLIILSTICSYTFARHKYDVVGAQGYGVYIDDKNVKVNLKLIDEKEYKKINDIAENEVLNRHTTELVNHFNKIIDNSKFNYRIYNNSMINITNELMKKIFKDNDPETFSMYTGRLYGYYSKGEQEFIKNNSAENPMPKNKESEDEIIRRYIREGLSKDIIEIYGKNFKKLKQSNEELKNEINKEIKDVLIEKDDKKYYPPKITLFSNNAVVKKGTSGVGYEVLSGENSAVVGNYAKANSNNSVVVGTYATSSNTEKAILNENGILEYAKNLVKKNKDENEYKNFKMLANHEADDKNIPQDKREEFIRDYIEKQIEIEAGTLANKKKIKEEFFKEYSEHTIKNEKGEEIKFFLKKNLNSPTDDYNTVIGYFSHVKGQKGTAVGAFSRALDNSVALGFNAKSLSNNSITIGDNTENKTNNSVVIGYNASSPNEENNKFESNVVIGNMTKGLGKAVVSIGNTAQSTGENSISIGNETKSINNGIAIGNKAFASDNNSSSTIAIGDEASATFSSAIAIGHNAKAGQMEISIGYNTKTYKIRDDSVPSENITLGNYAVSKGSRNIAFGMESRSEGYNSISIGEGAFSKSTSPEKFEAPSIALGHNAIAFGGSIALGKSATIAKGKRIEFTDEDDKKNKTTGENAEYVFSNYENGKIYGYKKEDDEIMHGVAIGDFSLTNTENGVALGSYSLSNREKGVLGYLSPNNAENYTWKSTYGAVSIGNEDTGMTRQLTGLSAGSEDTDAVNVAQLKELKNYVDYYSNPFEYYSKKYNRKVYRDAQGYYVITDNSRKNVEPGDIIIKAVDKLQVGNVESSINPTTVSQGSTSDKPSTKPEDNNDNYLVVVKDLKTIKGNAKKDKIEFSTFKTEINNNITEIKNDIKEVNKKSDLALSGVSNAVAMANLPNVSGDKKFNLSASYGYYGGSHAVAVGFSGTNDNQNFIYKLSGSVNSKGNLAFGIGAGVMMGSVNSKDKIIEKLIEKDKKQDDEIKELKKENSAIKQRMVQQDKIIQKIESIIENR